MKTHSISQRVNDAFAEEDWQGAIVLLNKELQRKPRDHWILDRLSAAHYENKDYDQALLFIEEARKIDGKCPLVQWDYAGTIFTLGRIREAYTIYRELLLKGVRKTAQDIQVDGGRVLACGPGQQRLSIGRRSFQVFC